MRKKSGFTIVEQAIMLVPDFQRVVRKLEQQVTLRGQSKSTLQNYIRRIAKLKALQRGWLGYFRMASVHGKLKTLMDEYPTD